MTTRILEDDMNELLDEYDLPGAILIIPSKDGNVGILCLNTSLDDLRQIAHSLVAELKDTRTLH